MSRNQSPFLTFQYPVRFNNGIKRRAAMNKKAQEGQGERRKVGQGEFKDRRGGAPNNVTDDEGNNGSDHSPDDFRRRIKSSVVSSFCSPVERFLIETVREVFSFSPMKMAKIISFLLA